MKRHIYNYLVVQNQNENTKFKVFNDVKLKWNKSRYLELENYHTGQIKTINIGYYTGRSRLLVSEEILEGVDISPRYIHARISGNGVILIENTKF